MSSIASRSIVPLDLSEQPLRLSEYSAPEANSRPKSLSLKALLGKFDERRLAAHLLRPSYLLRSPPKPVSLRITLQLGGGMGRLNTEPAPPFRTTDLNATDRCEAPGGQEFVAQREASLC